MNPLTQQWLDRAAEDYRIMLRESQVTEDPGYNAICFHAQQCAEKLLKAFLHENGICFPKTHDIGELFQLALPMRPEWKSLIVQYGFLSDYAVDARYPGESAFREEAERSSSRMRRYS